MPNTPHTIEERIERLAVMGYEVTVGMDGRWRCELSGPNGFILMAERYGSLKAALTAAEAQLKERDNG